MTHAADYEGTLQLPKYYLTFCKIPALSNCSEMIQMIDCMDCLKEMANKDIAEAKVKYLKLIYNKEFEDILK